MSFAYSTTGKLTTKQEQRLETISKIVYAFYDKDEGGQTSVPRTWGDIKRLTGLSNGVLSKHLATLIEHRVVEKIRKRDNREHLKTFYVYTRKVFRIEGEIGQTEVGSISIRTEQGRRTVYTYVPKRGSKQPPIFEAGRVHSDKDGVKDVEWGFSKRGKRGASKQERRYFVKNKRLPVS